MKPLLFLLLSFPILSAALTDVSVYKNTLDKSETFLAWLESHKADFAKCTPEKNGAVITLCDQTVINIKEAQKLFEMKPDELVAFIKNEKIKLEILCKSDRGTTFNKWCSSQLSRTIFKEVSSLHGQYIPNENTIAINSDSSLGSLVHEYFHYRQFKNDNKVFGKAYKHDRIEIQNSVVKAFDLLIADVQELEKAKKPNEAKALLKYATGLSDVLMKFGFWQKLIDERNLFLVYVNFQKELGIATEDVGLAKKNIGFLCNDKELKNLLSKEECL